MKRMLTAAEIDSMIDTLDRAEREETQIWRRPLFDLQEQLSRAQRVRRWIGAPLLGVALLAGSLVTEADWLTRIGYAWVLGAVALFLTQVALERVFPALDREARIQSLGAYFLPWRDDDDPEFREPKHDNA